MKNLFSLLLLALFVSCSKVPSGHVGVKVFLLGGDKGVDHEVLGVGRYWIGMNEDLFIFPTFQQNYVWTKDSTEGSETDESLTFQTSEGLNCNVDVGITYAVDPTKVSILFQKYRKGVSEITDIFLRNQVRDALNKLASTMSVEAVYGAGKAKLIEDVQKLVSDTVKENGIIIEKVYLIGSVRLPETVVAALNAKIEATQRAQQRENELKEAEAEARKKVAEAEGAAKVMVAKAEAEAKANALKRAAITPELIQYEAVQKWDGKLPSVTSSGTLPFLNINQSK